VSLYDRLLQEAKDANIDDQEKVQDLLKFIDNVQNDHAKQAAATKLKALIRQHRRHPFQQEQSRVQPRSSVKLGRGWKGGVVSLPVDSLTKHVLAVGQSGSGKTTLFYNIMSELDDQDIPFWAFDLKQDYRHLVNSEQVDDVLVIPVEKLRLNPLRPPPGVESKKWLSRFMEVFCDTQELLGGSDRFLDKQLHRFDDQAYGETLGDLREYIQERSVPPQRRAFQYRVEGSIGRLLRDAPRTFDVSKGYNLEDLLKRNVVFEFDGLKKWTKNFLMELLITWIYEYRKAQNHRGDGVRHVTFLDEAKTILSKYKEEQTASGLPEIDDRTAKLREFEESLIAADQESTKLTDSIKTNTYTKILLATGDAKEFRSIAESLKMDGLQKRWAKQLGVGEAVVQKGESSPLAVRLPDFRLEKGVTDDELVSLMSDEWRQLSFEPASSSSTGSEVEKSREEKDEEKDSEGNGVSDEGKRLLEDIARNPFRSVTERYEDFSSRYQGDKAKKELLEQELIDEKTVSLKQGRTKLFEITESGEELLDDLGVEFDRVGRGGIEHRYWQHRVSDKLGDAVIEKDHADVYVETGEDRIALEIALGRNEREIQHLSDRLEQDFDRVITLCRNNGVQSFIESKLEDTELPEEQVDILLLREFLDTEQPL